MAQVDKYCEGGSVNYQPSNFKQTECLGGCSQTIERGKKGCLQESDRRVIFDHHARRTGRKHSVLNVPVPFSQKRLDCRRPAARQSKVFDGDQAQSRQRSQHRPEVARYALRCHVPRCSPLSCLHLFYSLDCSRRSRFGLGTAVRQAGGEGPVRWRGQQLFDLGKQKGQVRSEKMCKKRDLLAPKGGAHPFA
jgi:hypothetical protein